MLLRLEDGDDRVALTDLALGDDPAEPLPVVPDGEIGGAGRSATPDPTRLRHLLDDPPRLGFGEGQAGRAVGQAEGFANLAFGQRLLAGHEVGLDAGDRGRHTPGGTHLAPRLGELEADRLGRGGPVASSDAGARSGASCHRHRKVAP